MSLHDPWRETVRGFRGHTGPSRETLTELGRIAKSHGFTLEALLAKGRSSDRALDARRECYAWLRRQHWTLEAIGKLFNRHYVSVFQALQTGEVRERRLARYRDYVKGKAA